MKKQLTEGEIKKFRGILFGKFGPYAFVMTNEQIQAIYEKIPDKLGQHPNQTIHGKRSLNDISRGSDIWDRYF